MLGYPCVDPQGHPIPARDGTIALASYEPLTSAPLGQTVVIRCVNTLDQARLRYIRELGLLPHTRIQVLDIAPFEGPLMVDIGERTVALARTIAHDIEVDCEGKEVAHE
jgi:DtxR family Mn-dependent transcriptional regulator